MSQPPQNGWGHPQSGDPYGQSAPGGNGQDQQGPYGQPSANGFGPQSANSYGQPSPNGFGQASPNGYGQGQPGSDGSPSFAPAFGSSEQTTQQAPVKKGPGKWPFIVGGCCVLLVLLLIVAGAGIYFFTRDSGSTEEKRTTESSTSEEETTSEEATTEEETTPGEETSEETDAAADGKGTKDSPYALGETFTIDDGEGGTLDVTLGEVNWDATDEVMGEYDQNTEPADDETYILLPVSLTYHGDGTAEPGFMTVVDYVSKSGNTYSDESALVPNDWLDVGTLHDGGTGEWDVGIIVPKDQIKDGSFTVQAIMDFSADPVWVSAA